MWKWKKLLIDTCRISSHFHYSTNSPKVIKTCIIGSGPAGFYAAQYLLKHLPNSQVDLIEKLPVPFGLVRFGVAPDHPEVKNVINTFTKTAENPNFRFFGNLTLGKDVTLKQLRQCYDAVLLSYGADVDASLNIPGEDKQNVISARELVAWYNGLPNIDFNPDLSGETAVLLGQGNVAIDVARILLSSVDELRKTDITEQALEALSRSRIKRVVLVGRRGPLQAAFTIKELREMLKLKDIQTKWRTEDFVGVQELIDGLPRPRKRITELMMKNLTEQKLEDNKKEFVPVFFRAPARINGDSAAESVDLAITQLVDSNAIPTGEFENIPAQLVCRSIGYKSISADEGINFDEKRGRVKNIDGRVLKKDTEEVDPGLYTAGWLATGPSGVILTTMNNSFGVAQTIIHDIQSGALKSDSTNKPGLNLNHHQVVTWHGWEKINKREIERGESAKKPREKILDVAEMMKIVAS